jgi:hypothetical protein
MLQQLSRGDERGVPEIGSCVAQPGAPLATQEHNYLLACIPFGTWAWRVQQSEVCRIRSDRDFFALLGNMYRKHRKNVSFSWLRKVKAINFVEVSLELKG